MSYLIATRLKTILLSLQAMPLVYTSTDELRLQHLLASTIKDFQLGNTDQLSPRQRHNLEQSLIVLTMQQQSLTQHLSGAYELPLLAWQSLHQALINAIQIVTADKTFFRP